MSGSRPPGFPARVQHDVVLALPSRSGSSSRRESQASVRGPARETPPCSPEDYIPEVEGDDQWGQSSGYDLWDDIEAEATQEDDRAHTPPAIVYTPVPLISDQYTPTA